MVTIDRSYTWALRSNKTVHREASLPVLRPESLRKWRVTDGQSVQRNMWKSGAPTGLSVTSKNNWDRDHGYDDLGDDDYDIDNDSDFWRRAGD